MKDKRFLKKPLTTALCRQVRNEIEKTRCDICMKMRQRVFPVVEENGSDGQVKAPMPVKGHVAVLSPPNNIPLKATVKTTFTTRSTVASEIARMIEEV